MPVLEFLVDLARIDVDQREALRDHLPALDDLEERRDGRQVAVVFRQHGQVFLAQLVVAVVPGTMIGERRIVDPLVDAARLVDHHGLGVLFARPRRGQEGGGNQQQPRKDATRTARLQHGREAHELGSERHGAGTIRENPVVCPTRPHGRRGRGRRPQTADRALHPAPARSRHSAGARRDRGANREPRRPQGKARTKGARATACGARRTRTNATQSRRTRCRPRPTGTGRPAEAGTPAGGCGMRLRAASSAPRARPVASRRRGVVSPPPKRCVARVDREHPPPPPLPARSRAGSRSPPAHCRWGKRPSR